MTRSEGNEIRMVETERWAGSLEEDVSRVLVENLSSLLAGKRIAVVRWSAAVQTMARIGTGWPSRFCASRPGGGYGDTEGAVRLFGPDGKKVISAGESILREPAGDRITRR